MKTFYQQDNIGNCKYTINFYDGINMHQDGSPFFGIRIFSNKIKLQKFVKELLSNGYIQKQ